MGEPAENHFLIPEHLNNYEIQYLWFPSVVCTYLNVNVFHYLLEVNPSLPPPPLCLSFLFIGLPTPSPSSQLFSVTSRKRQPKYNIYL